MRKIKIKEKEYTVGHDFSVNIKHEELFGEVLEIEKIREVKKMCQYAYAVLVAFGNDVPEYNEFLHEWKLAEFTQFLNAVTPDINDFHKMPGTMKQDESSDDSNP